MSGLRRVTSDAATALAEVAITDADVSMIANRRYVGSIADFTDDNIYAFPPASLGDVIELQITEGDDTYELILHTNGGVEITRLFITDEFMRFECRGGTDWRLVIDGRIPQRCSLTLNANVVQAAINGAYSTVPFDAATVDPHNLADVANNRMNIRRGGLFLADGSVAIVTSTVSSLSLYSLLLNNSTSHAFGYEMAQDQSKRINHSKTLDLESGTLQVQLYHLHGANRDFRGDPGQTHLNLVELL